MKDAIRIIATSDRNEEERAEIMIKDMCRLTSDLLDYKYAFDHYEGSEGSTVLRDKVNTIKNSMVLLMSDMKIYAEQMDITDDVETLIDKRINKIAEKVRR